ncbi:hypothetical protein LJC08_01255 [Methanimicrococcus sp. OttesenSCG-928-J09]|nr:hypothetical protein [Methanimicrococcus sp. OttesenSCG-928-J09]
MPDATVWNQVLVSSIWVEVFIEKSLRDFCGCRRRYRHNRYRRARAARFFEINEKTNHTFEKKKQKENEF